MLQGRLDVRLVPVCMVIHGRVGKKVVLMPKSGLAKTGLAGLHAMPMSIQVSISSHLWN